MRAKPRQIKSKRALKRYAEHEEIMILSHVDDLASVRRRMKNLAKTLARKSNELCKLCISQEHAEARWYKPKFHGSSFLL